MTPRIRCTTLVVAAVWLSAALVSSSALAAGGVVKDPTGIASDRYIYYPGTEALGADEIRLIALGTGMPAARRSQLRRSG